MSENSVSVFVFYFGHCGCPLGNRFGYIRLMVSLRTPNFGSPFEMFISLFRVILRCLYLPKRFRSHKNINICSHSEWYDLRNANYFLLLNDEPEKLQVFCDRLIDSSATFGNRTEHLKHKMPLGN